MSKPSASIVCLAICLFAASAAWGQNLATNPGFELGNTSGWSRFGSSTISVETSVIHSGIYAALVTNRTQTWNGISQSFLGVMQPGQAYYITAWLQLASGTNQTVALTIQQTVSGTTTYPFHVSGTATTNGWTQIAGSFALAPSGVLSALTLYAEVPSSSNAAYYIDDLSVVQIASSNDWQCVVNWASLGQRIDGFGASSAWNNSFTASQADMFFSTNTGIGLSLLRSRIAPDGSTLETNIMQMAQARGARVWSTPWSPPAAYKDTNSVNGGDFVSQYYQPYASQLANYVLNMKSNYGINIYAVSLQNEPQENTDYESCLWTAQQFHDFIPYVYTALSNNGVGATKILFAESANWSQSESFTDIAMSDPAVSNLVGIIGSHDYDQGCAPLDNGATTLWETEDSTFENYDGSISNGVWWAGQIWQMLSVAHVNAWHFWWLISGNPDNEGLTDTNGIPAKRMYALGNYSRFVRPGYYRVGVSNNSPALISAFRDSVSGQLALVAVNYLTNDLQVAFYIAGMNPTTLAPWVTSAALSLSNQPPISVTNSAFSYDLPPLSVVTFAGLDPSASPGLTINSGRTLRISGPAGMQYTLFSSTNFSNWQTVLTTNAAAVPFIWTETNPSAPAKYYKAQYSP